MSFASITLFSPQQCDSNNNNRWTNNNNLRCSDNNLKTKNDRCLSGTCVGTPYNCLSCETHDGNGCPIKSGYCIILQGGKRTCYAKNHYKPGNPCQVSHRSNKYNSLVLFCQLSSMKCLIALSEGNGCFYTNTNDRKLRH